MVSKPAITWYGCHPQNLLARPPNVLYEGICWHTTAGGTTIQQLANWFLGGNIAQGLRGSTHFGVDWDGNIGQFVEIGPDVMPIANGQEAGSTAYLVQQNPNLSANAYTFSIEHLDGGVPGKTTAIQLERSAQLSAWLWETYIQPHAWRTGATLDLNHLVQHQVFAPASRPFCASWPGARMQQQLQRIAALLNPPTPEPEPEPKPEPVPVTDWEIKYGQLDREVEAWLNDDTIGAEMRRQRLAELRVWQP